MIVYVCFGERGGREGRDRFRSKIGGNLENRVRAWRAVVAYGGEREQGG